MKVFAALPLLFFVTAALAQTPPEPTSSTVIQPRKIFEKCVAVTSEQKLEYEFSSDKPTDFNIHFHKGDVVRYPIRRNKTMGEGDRFSPTNPREEYCLMWENKSPSADVQLTYRYKIIK